MKMVSRKVSKASTVIKAVRGGSRASKKAAAARGRKRRIRQLSDLHVFAVNAASFSPSRPRPRFTPGWTAEIRLGGVTFGPVTLTSFGVAVFNDIPTPTEGIIQLTIDDAGGTQRFAGTYPTNQRYLVARF